jgi:hypothetical protein
MIEVATVDAHDESEQASGWFTVFEEHLELPFETAPPSRSLASTCAVTTGS